LSSEDPLAEDKGGMVDLAWYVFERDYDGLPVIDWLRG
jgi:hypothetical protein